MTDFSPHRCQYCRHICIVNKGWDALVETSANSSSQVKAWISVAEECFTREQLNDEFKNVFFLDITVSSLNSAATQGCGLGKALTLGVQGATEVVGSDLDLLQIAPLGLEFEQDARLDLHFVISVIKRLDKAADGVISGKIKPSVSYCALSTERYCHFTVLASQDSAVADIFPGRPINTLPASSMSFSKMRRWLQTCLNTHECCLRPCKTFMPSRLLKIRGREEKQELTLSDTRSTAYQPYAALSYCWGNLPVVKTEIDTVEAFKCGMVSSDLPASIRDAIEVATSLGIQYLWIDALCIVQDDPADVAKEIPLMSQIYSNATVTIAAKRSPGVHEGFLQERTPYIEGKEDLMFEVLVEAPKGNNTGTINLVSSRMGNQLEPLHTRGWAMQERFLSPRLLEFGVYQTTWVCNSIMLDGDNTDGYLDPCLAYSESDRPIQSAISDGLFPCNRLSRMIEDEFLGQGICYSGTRRDHSRRPMQLWYYIVMAYSNRSLTVPSDRILAISALAREFGSVLQYQYMYGLWKREPLSLAWAMSKDAARPKPTAYQGPSWSWASVNGRVDYRDVQVSTKHRNVQVLDYQADLLNSSDEYRSVSYGELRVKGMMVEVQWVRKSNKLTLDGTKVGDLIPDMREAGDGSGSCNWQTRPLHVLLVSNSGAALGLCQPDDGKFCRTGLAMIWSKPAISVNKFRLEEATIV